MNILNISSNSFTGGQGLIAALILAIAITIFVLALSFLGNGIIAIFNKILITILLLFLLAALTIYVADAGFGQDWGNQIINAF